MSFYQVEADGQCRYFKNDEDICEWMISAGIARAIMYELSPVASPDPAKMTCDVLSTHELSLASNGELEQRRINE